MIENIFFTFLLSHLVGDYVFQTSYIAKYKNSKVPVLLLHIFIIFISMFILLLPSSLNLKNLSIILFLTLIHFSIDSLKFKNRAKKSFNSHTYYILDQVMHFSSLMLVSLFYNPQNLFISLQYTKIISIALFNAYFISLLFYMIDGFKKPYKRDYLGYIFRMALPFIKYYNNILFLIFSFIFIMFSILLMIKKEEINTRSELGPLSLSIIITYLTIWR
ncbi:Protein of unknown function [Marinitoga hydrogenitolerans DSM 16785]|uniref:DUF3307 domain-containing protein n=1 Tax=Marinitoga hydrogenitolerans (strain DSM 16785 / JCM 12826 / AT1271) TaxID=1122195 RepID=A0A1M4U4L5_MARH1|nr:DUF3307 domain-containing protein [Marinitoga hydrogenitolerans]SHE51593.1 Protein of unknown function [Marinitoga hydrogenitolerans DSM 16785]